MKETSVTTSIMAWWRSWNYNAPKPVWRLLALLISFLYSLPLIAAPKTSATSQAEKFGFIYNIVTIGPTRIDNLLAKQRIFEKIAFEYGFEINKCEVVRQLEKSVQKRIEEYGKTWKSTDLGREQKILSAQCLPSSASTRSYIAQVTLDEEPDFGNQRRVTIALIPHGNNAGKEMRGGYAHKPYTERVPWAQMLGRAMERTINNTNEPPSIHVKGPSRIAVGQAARFDASNSWDPDGDPFELRWIATANACPGLDGPLPVNKKCPDGTSVYTYKVNLKAEDMRLRRSFVPEIIGDWTVRAEIFATPNASGHVEHPLTVTPRRRNFTGTRLTQINVPPGFFDTAGGIYNLNRLFYTRRLGFRDSWGQFDQYFDEIRMGVSLGTISDTWLSSYPKAEALLIGIEMDTRMYSVNARHGFAANIQLGYANLYIRDHQYTSEDLYQVEAFLGYALSLGNNYTARKSALCFHPLLCTEVLAGLSSVVIYNDYTESRLYTIAPSVVLAFNF